MTRRVRWIVIAVGVLVLIVAGSIVAIDLVRDRVDSAIPQVDLFGPGESPAASPSMSPSPSPSAGADITGPLNILIVGIDTREGQPGWVPHADAVMILHVARDLTHAHLTSLPRDLVVEIPAFSPARFGGERSKLTHAMSYGSRVPGSNRAHPAQGFQLVAKTVSRYTGIARFDAGALITFNGYRRLVDALGGIDLYIDQKVVSIHIQPDGKHRKACGRCEHGYSGPRVTYDKGLAHLVGWQALDYARQRYTAGSDYARQRHQRQLIKAMLVKAASTNLLTDPAALERIITALGSTLIMDGRGRRPTEFVYALRNVNPAGITLVGLPGYGLFPGGRYIGEALTSSVQAGYFAALRADRLDAWTKSHPDLVNAIRN